MKAIIILSAAFLLAGCQTMAIGTGQCITLTQNDQQVISDHLVGQIVSHNEDLRC